MSLTVWYVIMALVSFTAGVLLMAVVTSGKMRQLEEDVHALVVFINTHMPVSARKCQGTMAEHWQMFQQMRSHTRIDL